MTLKYFDTKDVEPLVEELFLLNFSQENVLFESRILPICRSSITYIFKNSQSIFFNGHETSVKNLIVTGQFSESYRLLVEKESFSYGMVFQPTALHKITGLDIHEITNQHLPLKTFSSELFQFLNPIFESHINDLEQLTLTLKNAILKFPVKTNDVIDQIDKVIDIIQKKEGMLNTYELLDAVDFSQKTLETHFKKIVGLTPGKYIRLHRFLTLMRKYEGKEIDLKDLIYMHNYYDHSHFGKDFNNFMKQSPKDYFKEEHPLLSEYLNK